MLAVFIAVFAGINAFAVDYDGDGIDDDPTQYVASETETYVEPTTAVQEETETEVYTQAETEEYVETTEQMEPETEDVQPETKEPEQAQNIQPEQAETTEFVAPTVPKTVSKKKYSTNYTAGIVSWICVGVGVITVAAVITSTKISARKSKRRQRY